MIRSSNYAIPKFTRGEKCIFFHLVLVFVATLILLIIFILHLYIVEHNKDSAVNTRRFASSSKDFHNTSTHIGAVLIDITPNVIVCNSLLLKTRWSVSPANCVIVRSHPDMANFLMSWKIVYKIHNTFVTQIKRSIVHSHFDKDTLGNNIGLFEHVTDIQLDQYLLPNGAIRDNDNMKNLRIISYYKRNDGDYIIQDHFASLFAMERCSQYTSPIVDLRSYEFCIVLQDRSVSLEYGALVVINDKIIGFFSWGERRMMHFPSVILNVSYFHDWLNTMSSTV